MRGRLIALVWAHDPTLYAPARYRRACKYEAFIPEPIAGMDFSLDARIVGVVSDAESAVRDLNEVARPALAPLARLLLRTESIASSKVEGMQMGVRELAHAEARAETGGKASPAALEIMANVDAMELAIHEATHVDRAQRTYRKARAQFESLGMSYWRQQAESGRRASCVA